MDAPFRFECLNEAVLLLAASVGSLSRIGEEPMVIGSSKRTFVRQHGATPTICTNPFTPQFSSFVANILEKKKTDKIESECVAKCQMHC